MKNLNLIFSLALCFVAFGLQAQMPGDVPPNADPGKCYAKCLVADQYETVTEQIETKAAGVRTEVVPATYETVTEQVMKKAESTRLVQVPATYETVTEQVEVKPATTRLIAVPATYETVTEQVEIKPATTRLIAVPATYETVTEQMVAQEEDRKLIPVPAVYETVTETYVSEEAGSRIETLTPKYETQTEQIETSPATTKWVKRKADRNCLSADPNDCLVWCLVEVPAQYRTVSRRINIGCDGSGVADAGCTRTVAIPEKTSTRTTRVLKTPATVREEVIPAKFKTVTRRVIKTPATTREEVIPAEYTTVTRRVIKTPASTREEVIPAEFATVTRRVVKTPATTRTIDVPAEYQTLTKRRLVSEGGFSEWREVLCGNKVTDYTVRQIQSALRSRGYDPGPADNVMGARTKSALTKYQQDNGLPVGNMDLKTLESLGIDY